MSVCRSCQAEVIFMPSAKSGKTVILDADPAKGTVLVDSDGVPQAHDSEDMPLWARVVDVYTDHHATCPNADDWRRR